MEGGDEKAKRDGHEDGWKVGVAFAFFADELGGEVEAEKKNRA